MPRFNPSITDWTYADPLLVCSINWIPDMNQTVEPLGTEFELTVDGTIKTPLTFDWTAATNFTITYSEAVLSPTLVTLRYTAASTRLLSLAGQLVTPFDIEIDAP